MSGKKYDLSQVSQATKDEYLQATIDCNTRKTHTTSVYYAALSKLHEEAEVRSPKTAREILEEYLRDEGQTGREGWDEVRKAVSAIYEALKVMP